MVTWSESCSYIDLTRVSWRVKVKKFTGYLVRFPYPLATGHPQACQMGKPDYTIPCKKTRKQILTPPPDDIDFPCPVRSEHEEQMVLISLGWGVQNSFARITLCHQGKVMGTTHVFTSSWSSYWWNSLAVLWEQNIFRDNVLCISNWNSSNRGFGDSEFQAKRVVTVEGASF